MAAWTDEESTRLTELHAAGKSLHFIANELGRSKRTISVWAEKLGLSFDRAETAKAAEAVHVDNKARRARIEERLLIEAEKVIDQMWSETLVFSFGGKDNTYEEHTLKQPTYSDQKTIAQTVATALNAANKLHEMNSEGRDLPAVDAWLIAMTSGDGVE